MKNFLANTTGKLALLFLLTLGIIPAGYAALPNIQGVALAQEQQCIDSGGTWGVISVEGGVPQSACTGCPSGASTIGTSCAAGTQTQEQACTNSGGTWGVISNEGGVPQYSCTGCPPRTTAAGTSCVAVVCPEGEVLIGLAQRECGPRGDGISLDGDFFQDTCISTGGSWREDSDPDSMYGGECYDCPAGTRSDGADCEPITRTQTQNLGCDPSVTSTCEAEDTCTDLENNCALIDRINGLLNIMAFLTLPIIILVVVVGGIQYSAANGDPGKVQAAKDRIYKALLALISFLFMWSFLQWLIPGGIV